MASMSKSGRAALLIFAAAAARPALAAQFAGALFTGTQATGGGTSSLGSYTYNPATNTYYTFGFNGTGQGIYQVSSVGTSSVTSSQLVGATEWDKFLIETDVAGDLNTAATATPTVGGGLLNPAPLTIGGITYAAGSIAIVLDGGKSSISGTGTIPSLSKLVYAYDLRPDQFDAGGNHSSPSMGGRDYNGDGLTEYNDVFYPIVSFADQQALNPSQTSTSNNVARRFAYSTDGQSIYFTDASTAYGGLYKVNLTATGSAAISKIYAAAAGINTEPAVVRTTVRDFGGNVGTGDQVVFAGTTEGGNVGGLSYVVDTGSAVSGQKTLLSAKQIAGFLDYNGASATLFSVTSDPTGNLYVENSNSTYGGYFAYDTAGRFYKVFSQAEQRAYLASLSPVVSYSASILQSQTRSVPYTYAGATAPSTINQLTYRDVSQKTVVGVNLTVPGDFNNDGVVDQADVALFKAHLGLRGAVSGSISTASPYTTVNPAAFQYDLNGAVQSGTSVYVSVDWKDAKIFQRLAGLSDGDVNMDGAVDNTDLTTLGANYNQDGKLFTDGNLTSVRITAPDKDMVNYADLVTLAANWTLAKPSAASVGNIPAGDISRAFAIGTGGTVSEFVNTAGGAANWSSAANWSNGVVPNAPGAVADLLTKPGNDTTITVDGGFTVGQINFDNYFTYTLAGPGTLTMKSPLGTFAEVNTFANSPVITAGFNVASTTLMTITYATDTLTLGGPFSIGAGQTLDKLGPGTLTISGVQSHGVGSTLALAAGTINVNSDPNGNLNLGVGPGTVANLAGIEHLANITSSGVINLSSANISAGTVDGSAGTFNVPAGSTVTADRIRQGTATIAGAVMLRPTGQVSAFTTLALTGTLDLSNNALALTNTNLSAATTLVAQGRIISSTAVADATGLTTIGIIQNNQSGSPLYTAAHPFGSYVPGASDTLLKYTYYGDANLDGVVDGSDYTRIDFGYQSGATGWFNGDFNGDGTVDGSDYTLIDNSYNRQAVALTTASIVATPTTLTAPVPEPAIGLAGLSMLAALGRRRRK